MVCAKKQLQKLINTTKPLESNSYKSQLGALLLELTPNLVFRYPWCFAWGFLGAVPQKFPESYIFNLLGFDPILSLTTYYQVHSFIEVGKLKMNLSEQETICDLRTYHMPFYI